ncbi:MAG: CCA tRNA nucleotidyltransferase [candidate division Zixibacteria bacterium]|nr:CCA tRNA nucleotidyltransferase [candidate division Zixibacteria bacterium]
MGKLSRDAVAAILEKGRIYEVGGVVRDRLLSRPQTEQDHDYLVTGIPYEEIVRILNPHGNVSLVGRSFGVIKFTQFVSGQPTTCDISLPRTEHSTGVGHKDFEVCYDPSLSIDDDLVRRDFTINAMAWELDGDELTDPLGGRADLEAHLLRMVYPESFLDDPLRMMRAIQFAARFDFSVEAETFAAICKHAHLIKTVSSERIADELTKLLTLAPKPSIGFRLMESSGLLKHVLPELQNCIAVDQPGGYHKYDVFGHIVRTVDVCPPNLALRWAAVFHDINKPQAKRVVGEGATFYGHEVQSARTAECVLKRLRYSHDLIADVKILVERHMFTTDVSPKGLRRLVKRVGVPLIYNLLDLRRADVEAQGMDGTTDDVDQFEKDIHEELDRKPPFSLQDLVVNGGMIMDWFILDPGQKVGLILDRLLEEVLDHPEHNTIDKLKDIATKFYNSLPDNSIIVSDKETDV